MEMFFVKCSETELKKKYVEIYVEQHYHIFWQNISDTALTHTLRIDMSSLRRILQRYFRNSVAARLKYFKSSFAAPPAWIAPGFALLVDFG